MRVTSRAPLTALLCLVLTTATATAADDAPIAANQTCGGGFSPSFRIAGEIAHPNTYSLADLKSKQSSKVNIAYYSGSSSFQSYTYVGVPLLDLIDAAEVRTDPRQKNDLLRKFLVVTGSDCYQAVIALAEILPTFGGEQVIVAFADGDGVRLPAEEGMARLILPGDKAGGRNVSNIVRISVQSPGPGPQSRP